ncbi:MAG: hypothetical protein ACR2HP_12705 [Ilumatobacteraceae bacterium]
MVTAVGSVVVGGVFFAFSTFVMKGLAGLPAPTGIAAMQAINLAAPAPRRRRCRRSNGRGRVDALPP